MKTLILLACLVLAGCSHFTPISEMTPEQAEKFIYLRERAYDMRNAADPLGARERSISNAVMIGVK